jgi:hypothetical protein
VIAVPPIDEQQAIVEVIRRERARHTAALAGVEKTAELVGERTRALIVAAVSGQIGSDALRQLD